ncbi:MAG: hydroxyisourate hydrolase [Gammaproteobacteria bacterium]|nr:hydroxyisourate hydrolase [Gammaproteobacteria bacterium]
MATVSSHILDSVTGKSAVGIRVQLKHLTSDSGIKTLFDIVSDKEGRIVEEVDVRDGEYELIFHLAEYFSVDSASVKTAVMRFSMTDNENRYHLPLMASPHSYSVWWSE